MKTKTPTELLQSVTLESVTARSSMLHEAKFMNYDTEYVLQDALIAIKLAPAFLNYFQNSVFITRHDVGNNYILHSLKLGCMYEVTSETTSYQMMNNQNELVPFVVTADTIKSRESKYGYSAIDAIDFPGGQASLLFVNNQFDWNLNM